jgi:hypothetical protein
MEALRAFQACSAECKTEARGLLARLQAGRQVLKINTAAPRGISGNSETFERSLSMRIGDSGRRGGYLGYPRRRRRPSRSNNPDCCTCEFGPRINTF